LPAAASYAEISAWLGEALSFAGRGAEAEKVFGEGDVVAKKILLVRPGHMGALRAGALAEANLGEMLVDEMRLGEAVTALRGAEVYGIQLAQLDPANFLTWNNLGEDQISMGEALADSGHTRAALEPMQRGMASYAQGDPSNFYIIWDTLEMSRKLTGLEAEMGDTPALNATMATLDKVQERGAKTAGFGRFIAGCDWTFLRANAALIKGEFDAAKKIAQSFPIDPAMDESQEEQRQFRGYCRHLLRGVIGGAEYGAGHDAAAEEALRSAVDIPQDVVTTDAERRSVGYMSTLLALALVRDNKSSEAQAVIAPVLKLQRGLFARNHDDYRQHVELASALYASALAGGGDRRALLAEATALIAGLPPEMRSLKTVVLWRERIRTAAAGSG
jgi:hypothetical protein